MIKYKIEEEYNGNFKLIGLDNQRNFEMSIKIGKRKIENVKYIQKQKDKINKEYEYFMSILNMLKKSNYPFMTIKNRNYYHASYITDSSVVFKVNEKQGFVFALSRSDYNGLKVSLFTDKYNTRSGLWNYVLGITSFKINKYNSLESIKNTLDKELKIAYQLIIKKENILNRVKEIFEMNHIKLEPAETSDFMTYRVENMYTTYHLERFICTEENKPPYQMAISLQRSDEKGYKLRFVKEVKNGRVVEWYSLFEISIGKDGSELAYHLQKHFGKSIEKKKKIHHLQELGFEVKVY